MEILQNCVHPDGQAAEHQHNVTGASRCSPPKRARIPSVKSYAEHKTAKDVRIIKNRPTVNHIKYILDLNTVKLILNVHILQMLVGKTVNFKKNMNR